MGVSSLLLCGSSGPNPVFQAQLQGPLSFVPSYRLLFFNRNIMLTFSLLLLTGEWVNIFSFFCTVEFLHIKYW